MSGLRQTGKAGGGIDMYGMQRQAFVCIAACLLKVRKAA